MLEKSYALNLIIKGIEGTMNKIGLEVEYPDGIRPPEVPFKEENGKSIIMYRGDAGRVRIELNGDKI